MSLRSVSLQKSNSASICILHLYAKYVKAFCILSDHNAITVNGVDGSRTRIMVAALVTPKARAGPSTHARASSGVRTVMLFTIVTERLSYGCGH